jgi:CheY-like chemotaxis protein
VPEHVVRVVLIEDNPGDAELVKEMLVGAGGGAFQVFFATNLLAGLDRIARSDIDLVLLDLSLPDSRVLDGLNAIRTHAPRLPVVVLTGLDNEALALRAVQCRAQDYLVKGTLQGPALCRTLQHAIVRHKLQIETPTEEPGREPAQVIGFMGAPAYRDALSRLRKKVQALPPPRARAARIGSDRL